MLVASLRDVIAQQSAEIESLQNKLKSPTDAGQQVSGIEFFTSIPVVLTFPSLCFSQHR